MSTVTKRIKITEEMKKELETIAELCRKLAPLIEEEVDAAYRWDMCVNETDLNVILFNTQLFRNHQLKLENEVLIAKGVITRNDLIRE